MHMKKGTKVSEAVIRRLPRYYRYLSDLQRKGIVRISSIALGKLMGLTASQIRQDLFCFGEFGQQGYGYRVDSLRAEIAAIIGITKGHTAVILGVGNLGHALMENFPFSSYGFDLMAAFDVNPALTGTKVGDIPIYHVDDLTRYLADHPASVGVLSVPKSVAQSTADRLVAAGVSGIWNFTNVELALANPDIILESVHFSDSLLALSYMISRPPAPKGEDEHET